MNKYQIIQFICSVIFLANSLIFGQSATIKGRVLDYSTNGPLPGANILIVGTSNGTATQNDGNFRLYLKEGKTVLRVSFLGYIKKDITIDVKEKKDIQLEIKLKPATLEGEEIVVTAQAKGQRDAINKQLTSKTISNIVSSARIQEIPDANAAESVGRLPGVSIQREGGEGNQVVIRGLAPKFSNIYVNGVRLSATGTNDRSVDLSMISPYMLDGIEVTKANLPYMDGDAVGGSVNFKLKRAESGSNYDFVVQSGYNDLKKSLGDYKLVSSYSNRFFEDNLGLFFQFDFENRNRSSQNLGVDYSIAAPKLNQVNKVDLWTLNLSDNSRTKNRIGGSFVLDYDIPNGKLGFENLINYAKTKSTLYGDSYIPQENRRVYSGDFGENILTIIISNLNYEQNFGPIKINSNISFSFSENNSPNWLNWSFSGASAFDGELTNFSIAPNLLPGYAKNKLEETYFQGIGSIDNISREKTLTFSSDLEYKFTISKYINGSFQTGGKFKYLDRFYDIEATGAKGVALPHDNPMKRAIWEVLLGPNKEGNGFFYPYTLFLDSEYDSREFLNGTYPFGNISKLELMQKIANKILKVEEWTVPDLSYSIGNDYTGDEKYIAGYAMVDINFNGIIQLISGFRYEEVHTKYNGISGNESAGFATVFPHKKTVEIRTNRFWLPMVHLRVKPLSWLDLRIAYTKTLNRPNYRWLIPTTLIGKNRVNWTNSKINPSISSNFDANLSVYNNHIGLFTIGGFYKNIADFMMDTGDKIIITPSDYGIGSNTKGKKINFIINNDKDVKIFGIETDWQTNFWYLPGVLRGLVFNINYTHIFSEANYPRTEVNNEFKFDENGIPYLIQTNIDTFYTARLLDQPNDIVNISLGYDYLGFSVRLSMLYQSDIFKRTHFWKELRSNTDDYLRWDLSLKQNLPINGLQVFFNWNNITSEMDRSILSSGNKYPILEEHYGSTMDIGLRYKL